MQHQRFDRGGGGGGGGGGSSRGGGGRGGGGGGGRGGHYAPRDSARPAAPAEKKSDIVSVGGAVGTIVRLGDVYISAKAAADAAAPDAPDAAALPKFVPLDTAVASESAISLDEQLTRAAQQLSLTLERDYPAHCDALLRAAAALPTKTLPLAALAAELNNRGSARFGAYVAFELSKRLAAAARALCTAAVPAPGTGAAAAGLALPAAAPAAPAAAAALSALLASGFGAAPTRDSAPESPLAAAALQLRLLTRFAAALAGMGVMTVGAFHALAIALLDCGAVDINNKTNTDSAQTEATQTEVTAKSESASAAGGLGALLATLQASTDGTSGAIAALPDCVPALADAASDSDSNPVAATVMALPASVSALSVAATDAIAEAVTDALVHSHPLLQLLAATDAAAAPAVAALAAAVLPRLEAWAVARAVHCAGNGSHPLFPVWETVNSNPNVPAAATGDMSATTGAEAEASLSLLPPLATALLTAFLGRAPSAAALSQSEEEGQGRYHTLVSVYSMLAPSRARCAELITASADTEQQLRHAAPELAAAVAAPLAEAAARLQTLAPARSRLGSATHATATSNPVNAVVTESTRVALVGVPAPARAAPLPSLHPGINGNGTAAAAVAESIDALVLQTAAADCIVTYGRLRDELAHALLTLPPLPTMGPDANNTGAESNGGDSASAAVKFYSSAEWGASLTPAASLSGLPSVVDAAVAALLAPSAGARPAPAAAMRLLVHLQLQDVAVPRQLGPRLLALFDRVGRLVPAAAARLAAFHAFHFTNASFLWPWERWEAALLEPALGPHAVFVRGVIERSVCLTFFENMVQHVPPPFHPLFPAQPLPFDYLSQGQLIIASAAGANPALPPPAASMLEASAALAVTVDATIRESGTAADIEHLARGFAARALPGSAAAHDYVSDAAAVTNARARSQALLNECVFLGIWPSMRFAADLAATAANITAAAMSDASSSVAATGADVDVDSAFASAAAVPPFAPSCGPDAVNPALTGVATALLRRGSPTHTHMREMLRRFGPALAACLAPLPAPVGAAAAGAVNSPRVVTARDGSAALQACAAHWVLLDQVSLFWRASRQHVEVVVPALVAMGAVAIESALGWLIGPAPAMGAFAAGAADDAYWATLRAVLALGLTDIATAAAKVADAARASATESSGSSAAAAGASAALAVQLHAAARAILRKQGQLLSAVLQGVAALEAKADQLAMAFPQPPMVLHEVAARAGAEAPLSEDALRRRVRGEAQGLIAAFATELAQSAAYLSPQAVQSYADSLQFVFQCHY